MLKEMVQRRPTAQFGLLTAREASCLALFCFVAVLSCVSVNGSQMIRSEVISTSLQPTSFIRWTEDLGYRKDQRYSLSLGTTGCPFVDVDISGVKVPLMLDTGTAKGLVITTSAPAAPYRIDGRSEELNADGSHRGYSSIIKVDAASILGRNFNNVSGSLSDWQMFSSEPFNGTIGLDFFLDRRLTLDYRSRRVATTDSPLPEKLDGERYVTLDLVDPPKSQGHILYARGKVNGREALIYFDTGYNVSFIDPAFAEGLVRVERPGRFRIFRMGVPVDLNSHKFVFDDVREDPIRRGPDLERPVAMIVGSDILVRFVVTVDLRVRKLILARAE